MNHRVLGYVDLRRKLGPCTRALRRHRPLGHLYLKPRLRRSPMKKESSYGVHGSLEQKRVVNPQNPRPRLLRFPMKKESSYGGDTLGKGKETVVILPDHPRLCREQKTFTRRHVPLKSTTCSTLTSTSSLSLRPASPQEQLALVFIGLRCRASHPQLTLLGRSRRKLGRPRKP